MIQSEVEYVLICTAEFRKQESRMVVHVLVAVVKSKASYFIHGWKMSGSGAARKFLIKLLTENIFVFLKKLFCS